MRGENTIKKMNWQSDRRRCIIKLPRKKKKRKSEYIN